MAEIKQFTSKADKAAEYIGEACDALESEYLQIKLKTDNSENKDISDEAWANLLEAAQEVSFRNAEVRK